MSKSLGNVIEPFQVADALRRRRAALLPDARGQLRRRRRGLARGLRDPLHDRARERVRQPREPHAGDDRAATATASCPTRSRPPSSPASSTGSPRPCARASTRSSSPQRSTRSGSASSGSTATSRTRSPGSSPRTRPQAEQLDEVLYTLAEGLRVVSVLLHPFMPGSAERLLAALGREDLVARRRALGRCRRRRADRRARAALPARRAPRRRPPEARPVIDTHCHLDDCEPPDGELVGRARGGGRRAGMATVGMNGDVDRARARAAAEEHDEVFAIVGRHPHETAGFDDRALEEIERAAAHPRARAIGETGLDYYRDYAPREDQRRAFEAQLELAARLGLPVVIHTRAAEDDTFAILREHAGGAPGGDPPLLLGARPPRGVRRARLPLLVRRQRHLPEGHRPPAAPPREVPAELLLVETDAPYLSPQPVRGKPERAGQRRAHRALRRRAARHRLRGARRHGRAQRRARASDGEPTSRARRASAACASSASGRTASSARTS